MYHVLFSRRHRVQMNVIWNKNAQSDKILVMNKLFGNRRTRYRNLILMILPFLLLCGVLGYVSYSSVKSIMPGEDSSANYKYSIDSMDYHLRTNATDLQIEYFHELQDLINDEEADQAAIAACVAKNYIADFYTWTNKSGSYDVGGMYYVYSPQKLNIIGQARDSYYKYLSYYINRFGSDKMLEVTGVETTVRDDNMVYEVEGKTFKAFKISCTWTYKNEETFSGLNITVSNQYQTKKLDSFVKNMDITVIINDDGRYEIVEAVGDI